MSTLIFAPPALPSVAIQSSHARFPVHRIYCVGRNYAAHAKEMGSDGREPPFFFMKPADAVVVDGADVPYPSRTANLHHEIELVVALGSGGKNIPAERALEHVYGYTVGLDLTRRDLQSQFKDKGQPWDVSKGFDHSAPITAITPAKVCGHLKQGRIWLKVNDQLKQEGDLSQLIWSVPEVIAELSTFFELAAGDLIFTGTPSGVGVIKPGDHLEGAVQGLDILRTKII